MSACSALDHLTKTALFCGGTEMQRATLLLSSSSWERCLDLNVGRRPRWNAVTFDTTCL